MDISDIEVIAEKLFKDLNHPQNADCREEVINRLKHSPSDFDGLLFETIDQYSMAKAFRRSCTVAIPDVPMIKAAVVKRWLEKIEAASSPA